jgi:hypothetical protein
VRRRGAEHGRERGRERGAGVVLARRVLLVALAVGLPIALWDRRGAAIGVLAFAVYGPLFLLGAFAPNRVAAPSRRHVALDAAIGIPLCFLAVAYVTDLALWACALIGVAIGALLIAVAVIRRDRRAPRSPSR